MISNICGIYRLWFIQYSTFYIFLLFHFSLFWLCMSYFLAVFKNDDGIIFTLSHADIVVKIKITSYFKFSKNY